jgi:holo-[acyl-carrier protein] synthase
MLGGIMRIGTDIVEVARITQAIVNERKRFLERVFTINEIKEIDGIDPNYERAAGFGLQKSQL